MINRVLPSPPLGHSDHCIVDFNVIVRRTNHFVVADDKTAKKRFNWYRGDYESINEYVSRVNWDSLICYNPCALSPWSAFIDVLWEAVDMFVPSISDKICRYKKYLREVRKLISMKKKLCRKLKLQPRDLKPSWEYRECCNKFIINCLEMIKQEEEKVVKSNNLGDFYRYVNKRLSYRSPIGCLINDKGDIITSD